MFVNAERCNQRAQLARGIGCALGALALSFSIAPQEVSAATGDRSGREVVETVCVACHATGANGAPKIGDKKAWSKRAEQGLTGLTQQALQGIRQMPAHGGNPGLTDLEIERAITYMVNNSGGQWSEPINKSSPPAARTGEQIVQLQCVKCHQTGVGGAPKIGDRAAWIPRIKQGLDTVVRSAINGHGGMPARGGMADLTDPEIRDAVIYMMNAGTGMPMTLSATAASGEDFVVIDGVTVYLGIVSSEEIRSTLTAQEATMHGGVPRGQYHVMVAVFDRATGQRVTDAAVTAKVSGTRGEGRDTPLEKMTIANSVTYGNYFPMPAAGAYKITVEVNRPGTAQSLEAQFNYLRP